MSELQETKDQSIHSPANEGQAHGTPLAEYIQSLFEPLRESLQDADRMATIDEFNPGVYRDAILRRIDLVGEKLKAVGEAIDAETDSWATVTSDGDEDSGFMVITGVQGGGGEYEVGETFKDSIRLLKSASDLLAQCEEVDDLDWISLSHVFLGSLKATEKYLLYTTGTICRDLREIRIKERPEGVDENPMVAYVERAEEFLEDQRKHNEMWEKKREKGRQVEEYVNRVQCAGCPVLVDLLVNHPEEADLLSVMFTVERAEGDSGPMPKWRVSDLSRGSEFRLVDSGGCLRALLEAQEFPQRTGIELAYCPKFADGTGCGLSPAASEAHAKLVEIIIEVLKDDIEAREDTKIADEGRLCDEEIIAFEQEISFHQRLIAHFEPRRNDPYALRDFFLYSLTRDTAELAEAFVRFGKHMLQGVEVTPPWDAPADAGSELSTAVAGQVALTQQGESV